MKPIKILGVFTLAIAAAQHVSSEPVLRQATVPVLCGKTSDVLTEVSKSPYKPFISTVRGGGATWVFIDPSDGEMIVLREFGDVVCFVAGGIIEKRDMSIFKDVKNVVGN